MVADNTPPESMKDLARRLLALEAAVRTADDPGEATLVLGKLRGSLARFAGPDGFGSLLRRALALARREVPALYAVTPQRDGSLDGLELSASAGRDGGAEAALAITAHLLGLLVAFVGEPLTLRLVRDAWPDAALRGDVEDSSEDDSRVVP